jgi:hypothetical protein
LVGGLRELVWRGFGKRFGVVEGWTWEKIFSLLRISKSGKASRMKKNGVEFNNFRAILLFFSCFQNNVDLTEAFRQDF